MKPRKLQKYLESNGISQEEFGKKVGVTQGAVWQWLEGRSRVSPRYFIPIEKETRGAVTRADLRPDLYQQARAA